MSASDEANAFDQSIKRTEADVAALIEGYQNDLDANTVVVFVDFHEDRSRKGPTFASALTTVEVNRKCWRVVQCHLHTGDVIIARVQPLREEEDGGDGDGDGTPSGFNHEASRTLIDETIRLDGNLPASSMLRNPETTEFAAIVIYERKTVGDLVSSIRGAKGYASENHLQSEISRQLEFARRTGARPRMLLEGYLTYGISRRPIGAMQEDGLHTLIQRLDFEDGVATVQTVDVYDSARTCLKDARFIHEKNVPANGWLRLGTGENRSQIISVKKSGNYDTGSWYRGCIQSIPGMSSERARIVSARYPNVRTLIQAYDGCEDAKHRRDMVANLRVESGKRNRIGPAVADRVEERFYAEAIDDSARPPPRAASAAVKRARK